LCSSTLLIYRHIMSQKADKKVVLVTGCSSGIGRELAREFYRQNYRVFASARNVDKLKELNEEGIDTVQLDVTNSASIEKALNELEKRAGRIDILVNNAGVSSYTPAVEVPMTELRDLMETNFFGLVALTQAVAQKFMIPKRSGKIVQISSIVGEITTPFNSIYSASKAAVTKYSDGLRLELAPFGVQVVIVKPGGVKSDIAANAAPKLSSVAGNSLYTRIWDYVSKRANASQSHPMETDTFAKIVVSRVLKANPPASIRAGPKSTLLFYLSKFSPYWLTDTVYSYMFGLSKLKAMVAAESK